MFWVYEAAVGTENDDESLTAAVHLSCEGDESSFRLLYRTLQPGILRYLRTLVGEEAEDIASETWVQVVRGLDTFQGGADDFRGWVTTIARNRAIDHLRRVRRRPVADAPVEELVMARPAAENTADSALAALGTDQALALLAGLPRDQAEALVLRIVLDLDVESTARILGKRPGAVRSAAHRGLRRLARILGGDIRADTTAAKHQTPATASKGDTTLAQRKDLVDTRATSAPAPPGQGQTSPTGRPGGARPRPDGSALEPGGPGAASDDRPAGDVTPTAPSEPTTGSTGEAMKPTNDKSPPQSVTQPDTGTLKDVR